MKPQSLLPPPPKRIVLLRGLGARLPQERELIMLCVLLCACAHVYFKHSWAGSRPGQWRAKEERVFLSEALWFLPSSCRVDLNRKLILCTPKAAWHTPWQDRMRRYWGMHLRHCHRHLHWTNPKLNVSPGPRALPDISFEFLKNYIPYLWCVCARTRVRAHAHTHVCHGI